MLVIVALPFSILFARERLAVLLQEITTIPIPTETEPNSLQKFEA